MSGIFEDVGSWIGNVGGAVLSPIMPGESGGVPVDNGSGTDGSGTTVTPSPAPSESWWDALGTFGQIALVAVGGYVVYRVVM